MKNVLLLFLMMIVAFTSPVYAINVKSPVANFTGNPTFGTAPLTVTFTDTSTGNPTGWAWYFGDETYTEPWTSMTPSAGWTARYGHSSVAMPDGSIVLMGGDSGIYKNDVWRLNPLGSSAQNTSHTFTRPGVYNVALQVYNAYGYNSKQKRGNINVTVPGAPVTSFTVIPLSG